MNVYLIADNGQEEFLLASVLQNIGLQVIRNRQLEAVVSGWSEQPAEIIVLAIDFANDHANRVAGDDPVAAIRQIRREAIVPVIMIVDLLREQMHLNLLEAGADLVLSRPYSLLLLASYVRVFLRRANGIPNRLLLPLQEGTLKLDPSTYTVQVSRQPPQRLSQLEYRLLYTLMLHRGQVLSTETLVEHVWGYSDSGDSTLVRGLVNRLRRKMEEDAQNPRYIHTIAGIGYLFQNQDVLPTARECQVSDI